MAGDNTFPFSYRDHLPLFLTLEARCLALPSTAALGPIEIAPEEYQLLAFKVTGITRSGKERSLKTPVLLAAKALEKLLGKGRKAIDDVKDKIGAAEVGITVVPTEDKEFGIAKGTEVQQLCTSPEIPNENTIKGTVVRTGTGKITLQETLAVLGLATPDPKEETYYNKSFINPGSISAINSVMVD
ncbi:hypothetical protein NE237_006782 [Protea cynaroides]|uniref:Uncharacterized protein n=1 Tax=Protea cynaroides TaxID=273540 RepID=A0A9Q0KMX1_9MAGN|nr:hypothetical protein NE237_006782 [Protea cynaroides]